MLELELQQCLQREYPQENACCEWKEYKNLRNSFCGDEKNDVISYVSAIANMEGGHLVIGVKDKTLEIVGTDISRLTFNGQPANTQSATFKLAEQCTYLSSEGLSIEEFVTEDTDKRVWIIHIPKHLPRRPVLAHKKAWQRIEDSLVEMTNERMSVILEEPIYTAKDWSAEIVSDATIDDLDEVAIAKARMMFKKVHSRIPTEEVNAWSVQTFLGKCGLIRNGGISLGIAKNTNQLPSYTKTKGLDKERLRQMILQYLSNAGEEGAKRESIYEYLKDVLPANKTEEQQLRYVGRLLVELYEEKQIDRIGLRWIFKDNNRSV